MARLTTVLSLTVALGLAAAAAACTASPSGASDEAAADTTATADAGTPPLEGAINPQIVSTLAAAGLTVDDLPADLDAVASDHTKLRAVMQSFTIALGTTCEGCHEAGVDGGRPNFDADTPRKNVARKMWSEFVGKLRKKDGSAIYCDTCHQGQFEFLNRDDDHALAQWMKANFVNGLSRKDGTTQTCASCHGNPFDDSFLDGWEQPPTTAPDAGTN